LRAAVVEAFGDHSRLVFREDHPDPEPRPGEALVRVRAAGVNHLDVDIRSGVSRMPFELPWILGTEFAGEVVESRGTLPDGVHVGDPVIVMRTIPCWRCPYCQSGLDNQCQNSGLFGVTRPGGYAEFSTVPVENLLPLRPSISFEAAAATQVGFTVAWHVLIERGQLRPGQIALINAAGSGIGSAGLQVARHAGARVIATASSAEKLERARPYADALVNYTDQDWVEQVREHSDGLGPHVVMSHVGGEEFKGSVRAVRRDGRVVVVGAHGGEVVDLDLIDVFRRQVQVIGSSRATQSEIRTVMGLVSEGVFTPFIDRILHLSEAATAHQLIEERKAFGKIVLQP